jgi:hypothetical protein
MIERTATPPELAIDHDTLGYIVVKAREFDAKVPPVESDPGSNPADDREEEILSDYADDPTLDELRAAIDELNEDEVVDLIALAWVGRGDYGPEDWPEARSMAQERHKRRSAAYLIGIPALGDYVEEGLAALGYDTSDFGSGHL